MPRDLLTVEDVTYGYAGSDWRLGPCSFSVQEGEILGIIGPNGSGKTTLLKLAAGVLTPRAGAVHLDGRLTAEMTRKEMARHVAYLPQHVETFFDYAVEDVVAMGRFPHAKGFGFLTAQDMEAVDRALFQTRTEALRNRPLSNLSGGEIQRALLASVIAQEPKVLLLDEPTGALDIHHQVRFFNLLSDLVASGVGVVVVTHELNLAGLFSHRLLLVSGGAITHHGPPGNLLTPDILYEVYGKEIVVSMHPTTNRPVVLPTKKKRKEREA
ncbi:MAG: ABC transporter ATP-binding protein, partial [Thermodesulfobacteriota bacterium]|nr:ABC transporter ATP-binding protein [Thermodesulfobacteriota bacterium]